MARGEQESYVSNRQRVAELDERRARIRALNDDLRRLRAGGRIMITPGIQALGSTAVQAIFHAIAAFDRFDPDNDPHDEHDFGALEHADARIFWKIDCYDKQLEWGSPDAADPEVTARVLTVMLAEEY